MFKRPASAEIDESSEAEVLNIRELMRDGATFRQAESSDGETSANLRILLDRVSETSAREVDNLIDELQRVREKLRDDGSRIHRGIRGIEPAGDEADRDNLRKPAKTTKRFAHPDIRGTTRQRRSAPHEYA